MSQVYIRRALMADGAFLLDLRNETYSATLSGGEGPISESDHERWMRQVALSQENFVFIAMCRDQAPVAYVRYEPFPNGPKDEFRVSIAVSQGFRSQGIGSAALLQSESSLQGCTETRRLIAQVRADNLASVRLFNSCGYKVLARLETIHVHWHLYWKGSSDSSSIGHP